MASNKMTILQQEIRPIIKLDDLAKDKTPFVSIIIATRNEEKNIGRLLDSISKQTLSPENFEIIIVDGQSKDKTLEIVESYKDRLNIRIYENFKIRSTFAFNLGVEEAKGDIFMIVNAHSYLDPNFLEEDLKTFEDIRQKDQNLAGVGGIYINESKSRMGRLIGLLYYSPFSGASSCRYNNRPHYSDSVIFGVFDKNIVKSVGKFDVDFIAAGNDNELAKRLRRKGYTLFTNPKIIAHYTTRDTFKKFLKQTFNYGVAQGIMVTKGHYSTNFRISSSFWFVPFSFLAYELFALITFAYSGFSNYFVFIPLVIYIITNVLVSTRIFLRTKSILSFALPPMYFLFHNILGISSFLGLILKKKGYR
jgi:dolichyl N-acetyl-alpha-D-glucosaminyl phosphate 3-beta-D-2,3-diacetamido-2,3-dideoxy-beta-D-glucuronosyltransferase